jgi:subtilisin-like proprotein convertase family protein
MTVTDVNVDLRIDHPHSQDLTLILRSPAGNKVILSKGNTKGKNLGEGGCPKEPLPMFPTFPTWMQLDDSSGFPLAGGPAPYVAHSFHPHRPLAPFNGTQANGTWKLTAKDTKDGEKGQIRCAMLVIPFDYS